ncbi:MAG: ammonium transporter [Lactobacillus sp.]
MNTINTLFIIVASILVLIMTPGLALFYGGQVSRRNSVNTMLTVLLPCGLSVALWLICGYSLSFSGGAHQLIGNLNHVLMHGIPLTALTVTKLPVPLFSLFQMMFAIITPALFVGAVVGRMRFGYLVTFITCWSLLVYYPLVHLVWGGGFLTDLGTLDFAGGTVVPINAGITALVLATGLGARKQPQTSHANLAAVLLGTTLLWLGWYGFNAGSALALNNAAVLATITTTVSASFALLSWLLLEYLTTKKVTLLGACTGAVCGLVAITPAAGYVDVAGAIGIGLGASLVSFSYIRYLKPYFKIDDALDVLGCHGMSGIWGSIATGLFATQQGLFYSGNWHQLAIQLLATAFTVGFTWLMTAIITKLLALVIPMRVTAQTEQVGLDQSLHDEQLVHF